MIVRLLRDRSTTYVEIRCVPDTVITLRTSTGVSSNQKTLRNASQQPVLAKAARVLADCKCTRRLATAKGSRVSISGRPCKNFPHLVWSPCKIWPFFVCCVRTWKVPKILVTLGPAPKRGFPPRNTLLPHKCYTKFRLSRSNLVGVDRGSQNFWGRLGPSPLAWGRGWSFRNTLLHHLCYGSKFGHSRSNHASVVNGDSAENFDPRPAFQDHSRSLEPIRLDLLPTCMNSY